MTANPTYFAPAERRDKAHIIKENEKLEGLDYINEFLSSLSQVIVVVNTKRQIVFTNKALLEQFGLDNPMEILGLRPGELLSCVNATKEPGGCGTSKECKYCGAVGTVLRCQSTGKKELGECRIVGKDDKGLPMNFDFEITASPLQVYNDTYYIVALADISAKKRKRTLERTFFHDIMNIAGGLSSIMDLLPDVDDEQREDFLQMAGVLSKQIVEEIKTQRMLLQAESGELAVRKEPLLSKEVLMKVLQQMYHHEVAHNKFIRISLESVDQNFFADSVLLNRVLVNMLKNALEATEEQGVVVMGCSLIGASKIRFWVKNDKVMPEDVRAQIFQRSFTTKGSGRGIGTYSIKLFGEKYLDGNVGFVSNDKEKTVFFIEI